MALLPYDGTMNANTDDGGNGKLKRTPTALHAHHSRRSALGLVLASGGSLSSGWRAIDRAAAQSTPGASPVSAMDYQRPEMLVDSSWLERHIADPSIVLVGFQPVEEFEAGHIPGSVQLDWPELEIADTSAASLADWEVSTSQLVARLGIGQSSAVVTYDNGTLFAARLWWVLAYLGYPPVHVLNGGLPGWIQAGGIVDTGPAAPPTPGLPGEARAPVADLLARFDEAKDSVAEPNIVFVDARSADEFARGHIPGAVNVNYPLNVNAASPPYWKSQAELLALYAGHGITPEKLIIPYCSSGVRSAVTAFTLRLIGFERVSLFTGSWNEWSAHPDAPIEVGS
jgi:thiosulfate/3-mercaptopyruvate sulfurtransferase